MHFLRIFLHEYERCIVLYRFIATKILISKYLFGDYFKWPQIKRTAVGLNRGRSFNLWWVVYVEAYISQQNIWKWVKHGFSTRVWVERIVHAVEKHWLTGKENVPRASFSLKVLLIYFWVMKWLIIIDFLEKGATINSIFSCKHLREKFTFVIAWPPNMYVWDCWILSTLISCVGCCFSINFRSRVIIALKQSFLR